MAQPKVKIELVNYGTLDLSNDFPIPLNLSITDVRDISKRNGTWSKTIKIPGTNNNNDIFAAVFNVNLQAQTFNPIIKEVAVISVDGMPTMEVVFQLRKVNKKYLNDEDFQVWYDCYLKSETSSLYNEISGKYLDDLDLSGLSHTWEIATVRESMESGNWTYGYQYWLGQIDSIYGDYQAQDLIPAIYAKTYWDKIFSEAGYTYEFDEQYDVLFDKLIVPYNGDTLQPRVAEQYRFAAGISTGYEYLLAASISGPGGNNSQFIGYGSNQFPELLGTGRAPVIFNDETTSPWFDPNGLYGPSTGNYNVTGFNGSMEFNTTYIVSLQLKMFSNTGGGATNTVVAQPGFAEVYVRSTLRVYDANDIQLGVLSIFNSDPISFDGNDMTTVYSTNFNVEAATFDINYNTIFNSAQWPGAAYVKNDIEYRWNLDSPSTWFGFRDPNSGDRYRANMYAVFYAQADEDAHFNNSPETAVVPGSPIFGNTLVPKKIKQSDFVLSLIKMHNLYLQPDDYNPTKIIVKTRDQFYADGSELNWTSKVDTKSIDVEIISNTQKKRKNFTYTPDDKDIISEAYTEQTNETYGELEYTFENEFIKDVDKVQPIFSPTFLTDERDHNGNYRTIPLINARAPKNNIRILYVGEMVNGNWSFYNGQGNIYS